MKLYELMKQFANETGTLEAEDLPHAHLGQSLALLHNCLIEAGLQQEAFEPHPVISDPPTAMEPNHLSRFVVGFLPFNSISTLEETNEILFQVYSFLRWLEKRDIANGWQQINFQKAVQTLTQDQERCLQLSHFLDAESGNTLEEPPPIVQTLSDIFKVTHIESPYATLNGQHTQENPRLHLSDEILKLIRVGDHLDLVLGDTSERWVILEAGQVFPELNNDRAIPA